MDKIIFRLHQILQQLAVLLLPITKVSSGGITDISAALKTSKRR
jgi:hypothetical protein